MGLKAITLILLLNVILLSSLSLVLVLDTDPHTDLKTAVEIISGVGLAFSAFVSGWLLYNFKSNKWIASTKL